MKKIAIVVNDSWAAYNFRFDLGLALKKNGYEVIFVSPYSLYSEKIKEVFAYVDVELSAKGKNPFKELQTIYNFYKIYRKITPDIILHYTIKPNIYGTFAASALGIPTINNIAGLGTLFINQNFVTKIAKWLYKFSQKRATKVFFQNNDDFNIFVTEKLVEKDKCDVLPGSGVDIKRFVPVDKENDDFFRFLIVSRMLWTKGIGEYVDAAEIIKNKYKNIEFQLLGFLDVQSPMAISKVQMDIWESSGIINYLGTSDDVRIEISKADCMVLPSYYREGTPRTLLESASMGKPIITTDNVGCRDVVDNGINGYLCKVRNAEDLADKMEMVLKLSDNERTLMGKKGREKVVKEFDEKIVINKYLKNIKEILLSP